MNNLKFYLFLAVSIARPSLCSKGFIYEIVEGNLLVYQQFYFTIRTDSVRGFILYCWDSQGNQMGLLVNRGTDREHNIRISFNEVFDMVPIKQLCGSDPREWTEVTFNVTLQNTIISVRCNNLTTEEKSKNDVKVDIKDKNAENIKRPIPAVIANRTNQMLIAMGNIGPYNGTSGTKVFPIKEQMIGCVLVFIHNTSKLTFPEGRSTLEPSCVSKCTSNTCNGGRCIERPAQSTLCDCNSTALNGPHCNRSLTAYSRDNGNTFEVRNSTAGAHLKVTWRTRPYRHYCLVNIVLGHGHVTISSSGTHIKVDGRTVSNIDDNGTNFVSVTLANEYCVIKSRYNESREECLSGEVRRINVGFSENNDSCVTFDGSYDIHFDPLEIRYQAQSKKRQTSPKSLIKYNESSSNKSPFNGRVILAISILATAGVMSLFIVILIVLYLRSQTQMKTQLERLAGISTNSLENRNCHFTETGVYGQVEDNVDYDYIHDADVYAKIDC